MANPYNNTENKGEQVERMFDHIAADYDRMNRIISMGLDKRWRSNAIHLLKPYDPKMILDVAIGTGDFAINMAQDLRESVDEIVGIDISEQMMQYAKSKMSDELKEIIHLRKEDATQMTFEDNTFDAVTTAFGLRNFEDIRKGLKEMYRVLKPNAPLVVLELTEPRNFFIKCGYKLWAFYILPLLGRIISSDKKAYEYLPKSIHDVPQREKLLEIMNEVGFKNTFFQSQRLGVATIYLGLK
ncbi:bifunctional demethylmenaquinone methyltransferase/2-methoxy-6-polyprenyl-1,4-benzoquinol methylase UbiE [Falsiporphyromonas endometrii]|uniref:Demethylmenaquinone methyltransferase n=1 Tax=Falsiporphyromonas endometrii TaxID=1387297 RepID=A0ABV9KAG5_9PORP|nr:bifunctional demethylmenaquinone methyltransferase/2-methoxy-6-polyprenyl-1,4-benzoquinol methylase UbiE [Porphyromonadaceae bacterium]